MAQADQTVQNNTFPVVRGDINSNLAALFSKSSGVSGPSTTAAYMDWVDISGASAVWKLRNPADSSWISIATISGNSIAFEGTLPSQTGNSGKYLTTDGTNASWAAVTSGGQLLRAPQILTSGTSYTTPANCTKIYVEAVGGGGGGGGGLFYVGSGIGGGGGSAGFAAKFFTVTASTSYTYAIGAGGNGGAIAGVGGTGGSTTFTVGATTITATGGSGGAGATTDGEGFPVSGGGGAGGTASNGDITRRGGPGYYGAGGGDSFFQVGAAVNVAGASGGVGGGGGIGNVVGKAGGSGMIRIWEYS
jgi:hypothetical protein